MGRRRKKTEQRMHETDRIREDGEKLPIPRRRNGLVNLLGMASALGIAFGSVFLVQAKLDKEAEILLGGEGMIEIPAQSYEIETQGVSAEETGERKLLAAEELVQVINNLDSETAEVYAHEPLQGQLSILQALECGRVWLEEFFLPHLGESVSGEYETSCHLWAMREEGAAEENRNLQFSYWTVTFNNEDIAASLTLNAVTGQVLDAHVSCFFPVEYSENGALMPLLEDYTDSFGLGKEYSYLIVGKDQKPEDGKWGMYQFLEGGELFSVVQAENYALSYVTGSTIVVQQNIFSIHLYVGTEIY